MPNKDHNFNQSCDSTNGSSSSTDECIQRTHIASKTNSVRTNHETIDLDSYRAEDSLAVQYTGHRNSKNKQKKQNKIILCCLVTAAVLVILTGMVVYLTIEVSKEKGRDENTCTFGECAVKTGKSIKDNKVEVIYKPDINVNESDECLSERCAFIADNLLKSMNFSVDPCQNFHEYSCGLWPKTHPLPPSMGKLDTMGLLNLKKTIYLKQTIEAALKKPQKRGFKSKITKFYKSCMNSDLIDQYGKSPLLKFIASFGKWGPIKTWEQTGEIVPDVTTLLVRSHRYFSISVYDDRVKSPLFKPVVKVNDNNSKKHIFEVS